MRQPFMFLAALVAALTCALTRPDLVDAESKPTAVESKPLPGDSNSPSVSSKTLPVETRIIDFGNGQSLGLLTLAHTGDDRYHSDPAALAISNKRKQIGPAQGKVTIQMPKNTMLCFEPNRRVFDNPKLMETIPDKIDVLFIQASALDDSELGRCDRLLLHLGKMQNLRELYTNRSDVTDHGLSQLPTLKSLELFGGWLNMLNGSCLERLSQEPSLRSLMLWGTGMSQSNLKYLPAMSKLTFLNAADMHITSSGLAYIGKCPKLKELHLAWNRKINDDDLNLLVPLQELTKLDLRATAITDRGLTTLLKFKHLETVILAETSVTLEGLQKLQPLHLKRLVVTDRNYNEKQIEMVKQICPAARVEKPKGHPVDKDTQRIFAPFSRDRGL